MSVMQFLYHYISFFLLNKITHMLYSYLGIILTYIICPSSFHNYVFSPELVDFISHGVYNCNYSGTWFYDTGDLYFAPRLC